MSLNTQSVQIVRRHQSPPLGILAIVFTLLFCAGLYPVTAFGGKPYFPGPWESAQTIVAFFQARPSAVLLCAFLQFGSAIPLGIFTASAVSRLKFLGVQAAGADIAFWPRRAKQIPSAACFAWRRGEPYSRRFSFHRTKSSLAYPLAATLLLISFSSISTLSSLSSALNLSSSVSGERISLAAAFSAART